jgi:hypothetical protein
LTGRSRQSALEEIALRRSNRDIGIDWPTSNRRSLE